MSRNSCIQTFAKCLEDNDWLHQALSCGYLVRRDNAFSFETIWSNLPHCLLTVFVPFSLIVLTVESQSAFTAAGNKLMQRELTHILHDLLMTHHAKLQNHSLALVPSTTTSPTAASTPAPSVVDAAQLASLQQEVQVLTRQVQALTQRLALLERDQLSSMVQMSAQFLLQMIQRIHAAVHWCTFTLLQLRTQFRLDWSSLQSETALVDPTRAGPADDDSTCEEGYNDPHITRAVSHYQECVTTDRWTVDTGLPCIDALVNVQSSADSFHTISHFESTPPSRQNQLALIPES